MKVVIKKKWKKRATGGVDLKTLVERIAELENRVAELEKRVAEIRAELAKKHNGVDHAIKLALERGVLFESDILDVPARDSVFAELRSKGFVVYECTRERVAASPEILELLLDELNKRGEEAVLADEKKARLFKLLRECGMLLYRPRHGWTLA